MATVCWSTALNFLLVHGTSFNTFCNACITCTNCNHCAPWLNCLLLPFSYVYIINLFVCVPALFCSLPDIREVRQRLKDKYKWYEETKEHIAKSKQFLQVRNLWLDNWRLSHYCSCSTYVRTYVHSRMYIHCYVHTYVIPKFHYGTVESFLFFREKFPT